MDRTAWIAVILSAVGLVVWYSYMATHTLPHPATPAGSATPAELAAVASPSVTPSVSPASPANTPAPSPTASVASFTETRETLTNGDVEFHLTNRGGAIAEAVLPRHKAEQGPVIMNAGNHLPIGAIMQDPANPDLPEFKLRREGEGVIAEYVSPEKVTIRKNYTLAAPESRDNYVGELELNVENGGSAAYANSGYYLALGSAAPIHAKDYPNYTRLVWCMDGRAKGIDVNWFGGGGGLFGIGGRAPQPVYQETLTKGAEWAAVSSQFFTTIVAPLTGKSDSIWGRRYEISVEQKLWGIEGAMHMPALNVPPGQTYSARFEIYAGPKLYHRLAQLPHNEAEIMDFGIFKIVCQFLLNALNLLHSFLGNYAASILALTVIIKLVLWPIQNRATQSARQMSMLAPKIQVLRDKYKDDPTRMNQEVMKMYKDYGINPVGGCLPMLIQIPIFFGLFTMLRQAVELRNSHFLWIRDLSQPDTVAHIPGLDWPINILPLLMAATNVWLMQITPKTGDPTQQRMMMFMPIIFVVFCYNFAAALALYYTTQNLLSIVQLYQNRRKPLPTLERVKSKK